MMSRELGISISMNFQDHYKGKAWSLSPKGVPALHRNILKLEEMDIWFVFNSRHGLEPCISMTRGNKLPFLQGTRETEEKKNAT
jgi:hypothetical protein